MGGKKRSFYGWGFEGDAVSAKELGWFERAWSELFQVDCFDPAPMPRESEITLRAPRMSLPTALKPFCTNNKYDRLLHCYGRSVHDLARMILRLDFSNPPDAVAYPRDEDEIRAVLDWHRRPTFRLSTTVRFRDYEKAVAAVRTISQAGLYPANARLIERDEAKFTEAGDGTYDLLVLSFESADHPLEPWMDRALQICGDYGGEWDRNALAEEDSQRRGAAGNWRDKFLRGPYLREHAIARGVMRDTTESCITWDRYMEFQTRVKDATLRAIREVTGRAGACTVRI